MPTPSKMKLHIAILHAAFAPERKALLDRLLASLPADADVTVTVIEDEQREGSWATCRRGIEAGLATEADWLISLDDDAIVLEDFYSAAKAALTSRAFYDVVCLYAGHDDAPSLMPEGGWLKTSDALVGVGFAMTPKMASELLTWVDSAIVPDRVKSADQVVSCWAMWNKHPIYTAVPSLVEHGDPNHSTISPDHVSHTHRTAAVAPILNHATRWTRLEKRVPNRFGSMAIWKHFPSTYTDKWNIEAAYLAARNGEPVSEKPRVLIATPCYREVDPNHREQIGKKNIWVDSRWKASRDAVVADLQAKGIQVDTLVTEGASLVMLARHAIQHLFLASTCTHVLLWDDDLELLTPEAPAKMLASGHPFVGGIYPFRDNKGKLAGGELLNFLPETQKTKQIILDEHRTFRTKEIPTGFMLLERKMVVDLCMRHPELFYRGDTAGLDDMPMWALFDTAVIQSRYVSEDYRFCAHALDAGYDVRAFVDAEFRHWGRDGKVGTATAREKLLGQPPLHLEKMSAATAAE